MTQHHATDAHTTEHHEEAAHGGHCGFVGSASAEDDGYWAETQIVDFVARVAESATIPA